MYACAELVLFALRSRRLAVAVAGDAGLYGTAKLICAYGAQCGVLIIVLVHGVYCTFACSVRFICQGECGSFFMHHQHKIVCVKF